MIKVKPTIASVSMPSAGTEYTYQLPAYTTHFIIQGDAELQLAITSGGNYITVQTSEGGFEQKLKSMASSVTFYLKSVFPDIQARIISWQN